MTTQSSILRTQVNQKDWYKKIQMSLGWLQNQLKERSQLNVDTQNP